MYLCLAKKKVGGMIGNVYFKSCESNKEEKGS